MNEQFKELKRLAEAATPGPWEVEGVDNEGEYGCGPDTGRGFKSYEIVADGKSLLDTINSDSAEVHVDYDEFGSYAWDDVGCRNANFIAEANPQVVLDLIRQLEESQQEITRLNTLSVTNIMTAIVPGDGDGHEVYAKSVDEVESLLSQLGERAEDADDFQSIITSIGKAATGYDFSGGLAEYVGDAFKQLAEAQKDAERYRWLRANSRNDFLYGTSNAMAVLVRPDKLDSAIDAAISKVTK